MLPKLPAYVLPRMFAALVVALTIGATALARMMSQRTLGRAEAVERARGERDRAVEVVDVDVHAHEADLAVLLEAGSAAGGLAEPGLAQGVVERVLEALPAVDGMTLALMWAKMKMGCAFVAAAPAFFLKKGNTAGAYHRTCFVGKPIPAGYTPVERAQCPVGRTFRRR